jgi:hypothetical protein
MSLDVEQLVRQMAGAASAVLKSKWPDVRSFAETEFRKLGETVLLIGRELANGEISQAEAETLLDMQKNAMRNVLLTVEGLGILAAEQAINAAFDAARPLINQAVGFALV